MMMQKLCFMTERFSLHPQNNPIYDMRMEKIIGDSSIIADFYDAVIHDREPQISGKEALKIQKLICAIYEEGTKTKKDFHVL